MTLWSRPLRIAAVAFLALTLTGCASVPSGGPTTSELLAKSDKPEADYSYELFDIDAQVARVAGAAVNDSFVGRFGGRGPKTEPTIGIGDSLNISIFEAALGGLFTPPADAALNSGAKSVNLPQVVVDAAGFIKVPYADKIHAAGQTVHQVETTIEERLKGRAIEPQAVVSLATNRSALVTVSGEVKTPNRFPIGIANERLLDVISEAGGATAEPHESVVSIVRGDRSATVSLKTVFDDARENVFVRAGDTILVQKRTRAVTFLGAASAVKEIPFQNEKMTLSEAIGIVGGLDDLRADISGIYVFRFERPDVVRKLRPGWVKTSPGALVPTVYRLDMRAASGYFLAQSFQLHDHDLVFAANAAGTQVAKVLQLVNAPLTTVTSLVSSAALAKTLK